MSGLAVLGSRGARGVTQDEHTRRFGTVKTARRSRQAGSPA
jgi:hypothetical protein